VDVVFAVIVQVEVKRGSLAAQITQAGLGAFLHHVAQRTGEQEISLARHARDFDVKHFPAGGRPSQARGDPVFGNFLRRLGDERWMAEIRLEGFRFKFEGFDLAIAADKFSCGFRASAAIPRSSCRTPASRVYSWISRRRVASGLYVAPAQTMFLKLARHEVTFRDLELFGLRVAGQFDDFEPVAQRRVNPAPANSPW